MPVLNPQPILDSIVAFRSAKVLMVGAYLGVFEQLQRARSAPEAARRLGLAPRAAEILLDSLAAVGYLRKRAGRYRNAPLAARFLVPGRTGYLGDNLKYQEIISEAWGELRGALRRGGAERPLSYWIKDHPGFIDEYIRGMDNIARGPAAEIARLLRLHRPRRMLDVGAGPGTYSCALLRRHAGLRAVLLDLPQTLRVTRGILSAAEVNPGRLELREGDYLHDDFGREKFDLVLMSHITHDEGPDTNRRLLGKAWAALRPGGKAVVHDFTVDASRTRPLFGALFSVHMLAYTAEGRTYTAGEYRRWMAAAGFRALTVRRIGVHSRNSTRIIVGTKPS